MENIDKIYKRRFGKYIEFRDNMWKILCRNFFQKYVPENSVVLDIAAGYCEFINNIKCSKKIALDLNPDLKKFADDNVELILSSSNKMHQIENSSVDIVFISNFFEHLEKTDIIETLKEIHRILKPAGKLLILQPNYRYCYKDYYSFFDHITPLDHNSFAEALETNYFNIIESRPKFLPYSINSKLPKSLFMLKLYLHMPFIHFIFGKQMFLYAQKEIK